MISFFKKEKPVSIYPMAFYVEKNENDHVFFLRKRNAEKVEEAKEVLGENYVFHPNYRSKCGII